MKTIRFYFRLAMLFAALPLMTACGSDDPLDVDDPSGIDEPTEQTQLATPVVAVNVDINAQTITASWQAVEHADNYHYQISGDETLYKTGETRLELQPYSKFEGGSHSITVQAVSNAQPDLFSPSEWGKADFTVESTKLQAPEALNADVNKESCIVTVSWAPVANAVSYLYKIDDGKEVTVDEPGISFSLFDYAPGEHSVSVKALAEGDAPTGRSASVKAVTAVASSDWSEVYTFTITDEPLPGMLGNKPLDHARLGDFYLNDGSLLRGDSELSAELADACIGIVFYAGRHETDLSDYTRPLTEGGPVLGSTVHGYVVSLTHVPTRLHDFYKPEDEPYINEWATYTRWCNALIQSEALIMEADNNTRIEHTKAYMGTIYNSYDDFNGYYNCMAMLEYIPATNHTCCEYPALMLAINYGKKSLGWKKTYYGIRESSAYGTSRGVKNLLVGMDVGDVCDWQLSLAAPQNSSGWFLPSYGQIRYAECAYWSDGYEYYESYGIWEFMDGQFEKVKNATTRDDLKEYIRAVYRYSPRESRDDPNHPGWIDSNIWRRRGIATSTEEEEYKAGRYYQMKYKACGGNAAEGPYVRPVLAF